MPQLTRRHLLGVAGAAAVASTSAGVTAPSAAAMPRLPGSRSRIDVHCHHIPDFYRRSLAEHGVLTAGGIPIPAWTPELAVSFMDDYGIAAQVVSVSEPGVTYLP
ncbi:MAG: hypothetical protein WCS84_17265, partial [Nocardioides sp.]